MKDLQAYSLFSISFMVIFVFHVYINYIKYIVIWSGLVNPKS